MEYVGYYLIQDGVCPVEVKFHLLTNLIVPTRVTEILSLIELYFLNQKNALASRLILNLYADYKSLIIDNVFLHLLGHHIYYYRLASLR